MAEKMMQSYVYAPKADLEALERIAQRHMVKASVVRRWAIREYIERHAADLFFDTPPENSDEASEVEQEAAA